MKSTWALVSSISETISNCAAYLRYLGVLSFGKGHLRAQVPSKASVNSAVRKITNAASGVPPVKDMMNKTRARNNLDKVKRSARYLIFLLYH